MGSFHCRLLVGNEAQRGKEVMRDGLRALGPLYLPTYHLVSFFQIKIFKEQSAVEHVHPVCALRLFLKA